MSASLLLLQLSPDLNMMGNKSWYRWKVGKWLFLPVYGMTWWVKHNIYSGSLQTGENLEMAGPRVSHLEKGLAFSELKGFEILKDGAAQ